MKIVMDAIGDVINLVVLFIQGPYIFIAGCIMGRNYCPGVESKAMYVWYPTEGAIKWWMRPDGDMTFDIVTYEELFH